MSKLKTLSVSVFLASMLLFSSCSQLSKKKVHVQKTVQKSFASICLAGSGKGRLTSGREKILFNFESLNDLEVSLWALALSIPLYGEEILKINWGNLDRVKSKGSLAKRLYVSLGKKRSRLKEFLKTLMAFLKLHYEVSNKKFVINSKSFEYFGFQGNILELSNKEFRLSLAKKDLNIFIKAFDFDEYYKRLSIELEGRKASLLKLELFYGDCSALVGK